MKTDKKLSKSFPNNMMVHDTVTRANFIVVASGIDELGGYKVVECVDKNNIKKVWFDPVRLSKGWVRPTIRAVDESQCSCKTPLPPVCVDDPNYCSVCDGFRH